MDIKEVGSQQQVEYLQYHLQPPRITHIQQESLQGEEDATIKHNRRMLCYVLQAKECNNEVETWKAYRMKDHREDVQSVSKVTTIMIRSGVGDGMIIHLKDRNEA